MSDTSSVQDPLNFVHALEEIADEFTCARQQLEHPENGEVRDQIQKKIEVYRSAREQLMPDLQQVSNGLKTTTPEVANSARVKTWTQLGSVIESITASIQSCIVLAQVHKKNLYSRKSALVQSWSTIMFSALDFVKQQGQADPALLVEDVTRPILLSSDLFFSDDNLEADLLVQMYERVIDFETNVERVIETLSKDDRVPSSYLDPLRRVAECKALMIEAMNMQACIEEMDSLDEHFRTSLSAIGLLFDVEDISGDSTASEEVK